MAPDRERTRRAGAASGGGGAAALRRGGGADGARRDGGSPRGGRRACRGAAAPRLAPRVRVPPLRRRPALAPSPPGRRPFAPGSARRRPRRGRRLASAPRGRASRRRSRPPHPQPARTISTPAATSAASRPSLPHRTRRSMLRQSAIAARARPGFAPLLTCPARMAGLYDLMLLDRSERPGGAAHGRGLRGGVAAQLGRRDRRVPRLGPEPDGVRDRPPARGRVPALPVQRRQRPARPAQPAPAHQRRRAALPHHQGQARPAAAAPAGAAVAAPPRRPRAAGHPGRRRAPPPTRRPRPDLPERSGRRARPPPSVEAPGRRAHSTRRVSRAVCNDSAKEPALFSNFPTGPVQTARGPSYTRSTVIEPS